MTNTLIIKFKNDLAYRETALFRGAIIGAVGDGCPGLFHNHVDEGFRYSYPLIQYKRIGGKAAIVCIGDGCDEIGAFFGSGGFRLRLGEDREETFEIAGITPHRTLIQAWDEGFSYYLRDWLPLNSDNYKQYQQMEGVAERAQMLERMLVGNILSACKGMGIRIVRPIEAKLLQIDTPRKVYYKGVPWMSFGGEVRCNVSLPDYIGLGKGASLGHGTIVRKYEDKQ